MSMDLGNEYLTQALKALLYYIGLILVMRFSGKRLAGQTTTFDLIVLITLGVVLQTSALQTGFANAMIFVIVVFSLHKVVALLCARFTRFRHLIRGTPRALVTDGIVMEKALEEEGISLEELKAGLRKLGLESTEHVKIAMLEETGHISAIKR
jgi:uncharacterized membrane protein YcaP (DUF421 family)